MKLVLFNPYTKTTDTMQNQISKIASYFLITGLFFSCNEQKPKESASTEVASEASLSTAETQNYDYAKNGDTIHLSICDTNNMIVGDLVYRLKEKDANIGKIQGEFKDSILFADYTFKSEGVTSVRQVAFKKVGNGLVEGYGDVEESNGKFVFKNPENLNFSDGLILEKTSN
ncbi:hypothetical protein [Sphingobacterium hungaricum]|uniref:NlpE N-terminal domain-containing protein n=1 Tax=Sphingobacterium hungaricum TaxID=2082723 RepID=A0A928YTK9_9SPHI|nr:hypothetical protein [Sphingobacterium hungaricum]MBE8715243.1 hypothetical protein [Sphingobacterium hungaricum]